MGATKTCPPQIPGAMMTPTRPKFPISGFVPYKNGELYCAWGGLQTAEGGRSSPSSVRVYHALYPVVHFLQVEPEALTLLCSTAMVDIAHLLRPKHLRQLASILKDPEVCPASVFCQSCPLRVLARCLKVFTKLPKSSSQAG